MRLFVGGLDFRTTEEGMVLHFTVVDKTKALNAQVIFDKETQRSKGYGFVDVETDLSLKEVIEMFQDHKLDGRKLTIGKAHARKEYDTGK